MKIRNVNNKAKVKIGDTEINGFVADKCVRCGSKKVYIADYDAYACLNEDIWLEKKCGDPKCGYCNFRPKKPMDIITNLEKIKERYENKILGIRNYTSKTHKQEFNTKDFSNHKTLIKILTEINTGESDITPAGKFFLEQYYGFDEVALRLWHEENFKASSGMSDFEEIRDWIKNINPMETVGFIAKSMGVVRGGERLRDNLLPPKLKQ